MNLEKDTMLTKKQREVLVRKALRNYYREDEKLGYWSRADTLEAIDEFIQDGKMIDEITFAVASAQESKTRRMLMREVY